MKPAIFLCVTVAFCLATLARAFVPFPRKNAVKMPQPWLAISKELASAINQGGDIYFDTVSEGVPVLNKYADNLVDMAVKTNKDVAARVRIIGALLRAVKDDVKAFRESFRVPPPTDGGSSVDARSEGNGLSQVSEDIDKAFEEVLERVHKVFPGSDKAAHHDDRQRLIKRILKEAEIELFKILCGKHKFIDEAAFRKFWRGVSPIIERIVVTLGDLAEQHPKLTEFVITGVISMLIPESWFTRPLLRLIGLGPVKGFLAAWVQRVLFGANFRTKPIFSKL